MAVSKVLDELEGMLVRCAEIAVSRVIQDLETRVTQEAERN